MNEATKQAILAAIRTILLTVGGVASAQGYISQETLTSVAGAIVVIIGAVWAVTDKFLAESKTQAREVVAVQAGVAAMKDQTSLINDPSDVKTKQEAKAVLADYAPPVSTVPK